MFDDAFDAPELPSAQTIIRSSAPRKTKSPATINRMRGFPGVLAGDSGGLDEKGEEGPGRAVSLNPNDPELPDVLC